MSQYCSPMTQQVWNHYVHDQILDPQLVRPHVAASWRRCRQQNVDPHRDHRMDISPVDLERRLARLQDLVHVALPTMENLYEFVQESGFQVVLADDHGYLLKVLGCEQIRHKTQDVQLCPGANWTESYKGTNAIGTCLIEKKPLQIHAWEHFCQAHHFLTCSAAPIFDPDGQLVAVLNMTGDHHQANDHTLGMVVAAAKAIEQQLSLRRAHHKLFAAYKYADTIMNTMSEGVLTVDCDGVITQINDMATRMMGLNDRSCVGQHVSTVLSSFTPILNLLRTGIDYENQKVVFEGNGRQFYSSGRQLFDDFGQQIGAVAVFKHTHCAPEQPQAVLISQPTRYRLDDIRGDSAVMVEARRRARIAANSDSTVLLTGESGTGKEMFAQSIHSLSRRSKHPFIALNCAATPESLIESELFGYEEGAFTGAAKGGRIGKIESAVGGTLFLDEIGDMPLYTQVKLLRVIQERKLSRLGATTEIPVDIRIIAATHRDLIEEIGAGRFREDLFYRLNVIPLRIAPLRQRCEDLPLLVHHLVKAIARRLERGTIHVSDDFVAACRAYSWPGNVRELENVIERAINMVDEDRQLTPQLMELTSELSLGADEHLQPVRPLKEVERELLIQALHSCQGNIVQASNLLGISRNTIYRKIREFDIDI